MTMINTAAVVGEVQALVNRAAHAMTKDERAIQEVWIRALFNDRVPTREERLKMASDIIAMIAFDEHEKPF